MVETMGGTYRLGDKVVRRMGYGAMQLAGPHVFGPPKDRGTAVAVLREAVERGVEHIDTSDFYGPHVTNQIIREALAPYPEGLVIVTKLGVVRDAAGGWIPARAPEDLERGVEDNLRNLGLEVLEVVNLRLGAQSAPVEGSIERQVETMADLQRRGLIRHVGLSNVTAAQVAEARRVVEVVCVQNYYNLVHRRDEALVDQLAAEGTAYVPFFPLGGFTPLQAVGLSVVAERLGKTPMQVALAWLLHRAPNVMLIPGTSSVAHLRENLAAAALELGDEVLADLDAVAS